MNYYYLNRFHRFFLTLFLHLLLSQHALLLKFNDTIVLTCKYDGSASNIPVTTELPPQALFPHPRNLHDEPSTRRPVSLSGAVISWQLKQENIGDKISYICTSGGCKCDALDKKVLTRNPVPHCTKNSFSISVNVRCDSVGVYSCSNSTTYPNDFSIADYRIDINETLYAISAPKMDLMEGEEFVGTCTRSVPIAIAKRELLQRLQQHQDQDFYWFFDNGTVVPSRYISRRYTRWQTDKEDEACLQNSTLGMKIPVDLNITGFTCGKHGSGGEKNNAFSRREPINILYSLRSQTRFWYAKDFVPMNERGFNYSLPPSSISFTQRFHSKRNGLIFNCFAVDDNNMLWANPLLLTMHLSMPHNKSFLPRTKISNFSGSFGAVQRRGYSFGPDPARHASIYVDQRFLNEDDSRAMIFKLTCTVRWARNLTDYRTITRHLEIHDHLRAFYAWFIPVIILVIFLLIIAIIVAIIIFRTVKMRYDVSRRRRMQNTVAVKSQTSFDNGAYDNSTDTAAGGVSSNSNGGGGGGQRAAEPKSTTTSKTCGFDNTTVKTRGGATKF